jgi:hypothetical protein
MNFSGVRNATRALLPRFAARKSQQTTPQASPVTSLQGRAGMSTRLLGLSRGNEGDGSIAHSQKAGPRYQIRLPAAGRRHKGAPQGAVLRFEPGFPLVVATTRISALRIPTSVAIFLKYDATSAMLAGDVGNGAAERHATTIARAGCGTLGHPVSTRQPTIRISTNCAST